MRHKFLVLPVKKLLKSVHIYGSYRKIKTGAVFLEHPVVAQLSKSVHFLDIVNESIKLCSCLKI